MASSLKKAEATCCGKCPKAEQGSCTRLDKALAALKKREEAA